MQTVATAQSMPGGRPTLYRPEYVEQAYKLGLLGLTDEEMSRFFEIDLTTLYRWDKVHPEFCQSRARGKSPADAEVATKLYHRCLGYSHGAVKIMQYEGNPIEVPYTEHYPPDTQAATWWLKNRQPDKWRDRQEIAGTGGMVVTHVVEDRRRLAGDLLGQLMPPTIEHETPEESCTPSDVSVHK